MKKFFKKLLGIDKLEELAAKGAEALAAEKAAEEEAARILAAQEAERNLSPKEKANLNKEPYINVDRVMMDSKNPGQGVFELDWNVYFIENLIKSGYRGETDEKIVDQWFSDVCRNVVLETYEQYDANNVERIRRRDIGNGRSEFS